MEKIKENKTFDGFTRIYEFDSPSTKTKMKFSTFEPKAGKVKKAIIWLSGLTCNEENFITKAGGQALLAEKDVMIICPDTSPRGLDLPSEHESYDFGSGAGFYINAKTKGYEDHYQMYDFIKNDIVNILKSEFGVERVSIMGHSMGGHGALILGLNEKDLFKSISAFSPLANPINCEWGQKAFKGYLGENWKIDAVKYDATSLVQNGANHPLPILIDQGTSDEFYPEQLLTQNFENACKEHNQKVRVNLRDGYDHSYFFISTYLKNHIDFHLKALNV